MGITYIIGDATAPLQVGEVNCPCVLLDETTCLNCGPFCYHITGEGTCEWCDGTGIVTAEKEQRWPNALANLRRVAAQKKCECAERKP